MHPEPFKQGTNNFARYYGLLIDGLQTSYINGFAYNQVRPAPDDEIPQRFARADEVLAGKLWRDQLREWDDEVKPAGIAKHREIQAVDPDALSDDELAAYLVRCRDHHAAMIVQHMSYTAGAMIPTGDFLAHVGDWTSLSHAELLGLLRGSAAVSAGGSDEQERLKTIADDPEAVRILASDGDAGRRARAAPRAPRRHRCRGQRLPRPRRLPSPRRLRHLRARRARAPRRAAAGDQDHDRGSRPHRRRRVGAHRRGARAGARRSTARSSTRSSARRASCTACATSAASTATSGRRASCAAPRSPPVDAWPRAATSPSRCTWSTRASTRCARW